MSLTPSQMRAIKQEAARLEKWADTVSFSYSPTVVRFSPSYGTDQMILSLLKEMPAVGAKIQKEYNILDQFFQDVCNRYRKPITTDGDEEELQILADTARGCARQIAEELRHIARMSESEEQAGTEQKATREKPEKENWFLRLYRITVTSFWYAFWDKVLRR